MGPIALFGIDNDGIGVALNLLILFLIVLWTALVYWTFADARRRVEDPVLVVCAGLAALLFPIAGAVVYTIVRPPETLDDRLERDLEIRAAELRVELLEQALRGGPNGSSYSSALAGELAGEPVARTGPKSQPRTAASQQQQSQQQQRERQTPPQGGAQRSSAPGPQPGQAPPPRRRDQGGLPPIHRGDPPPGNAA